MALTFGYISLISAYTQAVLRETEDKNFTTAELKTLLSTVVTPASTANKICTTLFQTNSNDEGQGSINYILILLNSPFVDNALLKELLPSENNVMQNGYIKQRRVLYNLNLKSQNSNAEKVKTLERFIAHLFKEPDFSFEKQDAADAAAATAAAATVTATAAATAAAVRPSSPLPPSQFFQPPAGCGPTQKMKGFTDKKTP